MNDKSKKTIRTALQVALGIAVALPLLLDATGLKPADVPWLAIVVAGAALFARAMQSDVVEQLLEDWLGGRLTVGGGVPALPPVVVPDVDEHDAGEV